jgi:hypothetical protein
MIPPVVGSGDQAHGTGHPFGNAAGDPLAVLAGERENDLRRGDPDSPILRDSDTANIAAGSLGAIHRSLDSDRSGRSGFRFRSRSFAIVIEQQSQTCNLTQQPGI